MRRLLIPNTTQFPNVLLEDVIPKLPPGAVRVLLAIVRFTYGFGRESDRISLTQLQRATGLSRWRVNEGVKALRNVVNVKPGAKGKGANEYTLNLDVSTGELVTKGDQSQKVTSHLGSHLKRLSQTYSKPKERERVKDKPSPDSFFPTIERTIRRLNELSGKTYRPHSKDVTKYLLARLKDGATLEECLAVVEDRWRRWKDKPEMVEHFNPVTLFRKSKFEIYLTETRTGQAENSRPPEVKDLGNGLLEVDGKQMDRKTYELRYSNARPREA